MKKILVLALATALVGGAALAVWNAQDVVPAASLLVPYAVVSSNAAGTATVADGWTTKFAITNVSSEAILVHITVWSARSSAVVDWDIVLTGYDVWTIDFKDMLDGNFQLFDTALGAHVSGQPSGHTWTPAGWGPYYNKVASPAGELNAAGTLAAGTGCIMPYGVQDVFGGIIRTKIRAGQAAAPDLWYTCDGDRVTANTTTLGTLTDADPFFFYVTADVVSACTKNFQNTSSYWGTALVNRNVNVIIGDILYLNQTSRYSEMLNAVHLESIGLTVPPAGIITFYELDMWDVAFTGATPDGTDDREPLGTEYAFRYSTSPSPLQSNVIVWKSQNSLYYDLLDEYTDGCRDYRYWAWNEDELTKSHQGGGPSGSLDVLEPCALCFETQKIPVNINNFPGLVTVASKVPTGAVAGGAGFGWVWIDFIGRHFTDTVDNPLEAYVAMEFVFQNYATAVAAPLLWTPYNRSAGSAVFGPFPANGPIPATKPAPSDDPLAYSFVPAP